MHGFIGVVLAIMLDKNGLALAILMSILIVMFSDSRFLFLMIAFFVFAVAATRYNHTAKRDMGIYEHERSWENVFSNGLLPTLLALGHYYFGVIPFIASVAAITADKFASELGVFSGKPISLLTLKPVQPGTSGAVTFFGSFMSLAGSALIGTSAIFLFGISPKTALFISFAGFAGSFVDSILGVAEEKGIGTKGTTNFFCSLTGALLAYFFIR